MNRPDNSRRSFLAKSVYSAAILAANPIRNAFGINQETSSGNQVISGTTLTVNPPNIIV